MALDVVASPGLVDVMDRLWFHEIILFSSSSLATKTLHKQTHQSLPLHYEPKHHDDERDQAEDIITRPSRTSLTTNRGRSHSSSLLTKKRRRCYSRMPSSSRDHNLRAVIHPFMSMVSPGGEGMMVFERSSSCKSLRYLELEELKGFMDLGFRFKKESLSPKMLSVLPGLQRLGAHGIEQIISTANNDDDDDCGEMAAIRPYLSEAWVTRRRPDSSALLNMRLPRVSAACDMKRHLKFWARTVASTVIRQES